MLTQLENGAIRESSRLRLESIRHRLNLLTTFCSVAKTELKFGTVYGAKCLMEKVHHSLNEITRHVSEPGYVPTDQVALLKIQLARVKERASEIEQNLLFLDF